MKDRFDRASSLLKFDAGLQIFKIIDTGKKASSLGRCENKLSAWLNDEELRDGIKGIDFSRLFFVKTKFTDRQILF